MMTTYSKISIVGLLIAGTIFSGCRAKKIAGAPAADTIAFQKKQTWAFSGNDIRFSNQFGSARLNKVTQENDSTFTLLIEPENTPINNSPWYAFKVWSEKALSNGKAKTVNLKLTYAGTKHRYQPKWSTDSKKWENVSNVVLNNNKAEAVFKVNLTSDTLIIAAQELMGIHHTYSWTDSLAKLPYVKKRLIGQSILNKPIYALNSTESDGKKIVAIIGRLHPPEITGYIAMQEFIGVLLGNTAQAKEFRSKYEIALVPMVNPDGIEAGNWRHNIAGVDLNRDWMGFKQPEIRAVRDYLLAEAKNDSKIMVGLDFHSTFFDVFYTNDDDPANSTHLSGFMSEWLKAYEGSFNGFKANVKPSPNGGVTSKAWMGRALKAEAVTYEVGDNTPRGKMRSNARIFAEKMMILLLEKDNNK